MVLNSRLSRLTFMSMMPTKISPENSHSPACFSCIFQTIPGIELKKKKDCCKKWKKEKRCKKCPAN